ncbi:uncharacterized protein BJ212DRAFT_1485339 [Suillus subaureus]|uniref:ubiquitinyl hydrolase 1 n=1 Tax=Suillus subaureus TaxID=48587 RepID=A0A9P7E143_9AGAM|nr:uncharacterized protein BJ212DRAFT_1485339 [Suillus subaureus]KAG1808061.1 hypothetical protein BJ212DRAFT_1485339 [Suillus subaureus]
MDESEITEALSFPVGLKSMLLFLTCVARDLTPTSDRSPHLDVLPRALRDLYSNMSRTTEGHIPTAFLTVLHQGVLQFGEIDGSGKNGMLGGYVQQDAEGCCQWTQLTNGLKEVPEIDTTGNTVVGGRRFVDQFMMAEMHLKCDKAPEEPSIVTIEKVLKIKCDISATTNSMHTGIKDICAFFVPGLVFAYAHTGNELSIGKELGRQAVYSQTLRLSRLPSYLTVHMVRFAWRRDIGKKAKIMRKVKFASEFDALEVVTEELMPVSSLLKSKDEPLDLKAGDA